MPGTGAVGLRNNYGFEGMGSYTPFLQEVGRGVPRAAIDYNDLVRTKAAESIYRFEQPLQPAAAISSVVSSN